jgi:putative inorganic carbon (HCO3(-)) transporter
MSERLRDAPRRLAWVSFVVLVVLSPFRAAIVLAPRDNPAISQFYTSFTLAWTDVATLATLGFWVVSLVIMRRRVHFGPRFIAWPAAGLLAVSWLGVPVSVDPALAAYGAIKLSVVVALGVYVINEVGRVGRLAAPIAVMIAIQAAVSVAQVIGQGSVGLGLLGEHGGLDPAVSGVSIVATAEGSRWLRAYGLAEHPNVLGGVLTITLLLLVTGLARARAWRMAETIAFAAGVAVLLLTFSRGAWIGFAAGLGVAVALAIRLHERSVSRRWAGAVLVAGLVAGVFVLAFAPYLAARATISGPIDTEERSIDERAALATRAGDLFLARPLLGSGSGTMPVALWIADPEFPYANQPAHVVVLTAAAETGIAGALCYVVLMAAPFVALAGPRVRWSASLIGTSGALAAVAVIGLFDYYTWSPSAGRTWAWIALGLWVVAYRRLPGGVEDG